MYYHAYSTLAVILLLFYSTTWWCRPLRRPLAVPYQCFQLVVYSWWYMCVCSTPWWCGALKRPPTGTRTPVIVLLYDGTIPSTITMMIHVISAVRRTPWRCGPLTGRSRSWGYAHRVAVQLYITIKSTIIMIVSCHYYSTPWWYGAPTRPLTVARTWSSCFCTPARY